MTVANGPSLLKRIVFFGFIAVMASGTLAMSTYKIGVANAYLTLGSPEPQTPYTRVASTPERIARGREVAALVGCADCHGADYGGKALLTAQQGATLNAPNLTLGAGGRGETLHTSRGWEAVRTGLDTEHRTLWAMPRTALMAMADSDVDAVLAFVASRAPIDRIHSQNKLFFWGYIAMATRQLKLIDRSQVPVVPRVMPATIGIGNAAIPLGAVPVEHALFVARPPQAGDSAFAPYVQALGRCQDCHGAVSARPGCTPAAPVPPGAKDLRRCLVGGRFTTLDPSTQAALLAK